MEKTPAAGGVTYEKAEVDERFSSGCLTPISPKWLAGFRVRNRFS
jgi:hypothetical protein